MAGCVYYFSVDYYSIDNSDIEDIHKYLIKNNIVSMFRFIKQALALVCFGGLPATVYL